MIYITLGTQGKDFSRCLKSMETLIRKYNINEEVIAQVGFTKYKSDYMKCIPFVSESEYRDYINQASVIISHAGSGALFSAIKSGKPTIAIARLSRYGEMVNDHQLELVTKLAEDGDIIDGTFNLEEAWKKLQSFTPRPNDFKCSIADRVKQLLLDWHINALDH